MPVLCQQMSSEVAADKCLAPEASAAQRDHGAMSPLPRHPPGPGTLRCSPGQAALLPGTRLHWALPVLPEPATLMGVLPFLSPASSCYQRPTAQCLDCAGISSGAGSCSAGLDLP